jgi:hypothetical protein
MQTFGKMLKAQENLGSTIENGDKEWEECPSTGVNMSIP